MSTFAAQLEADSMFHVHFLGYENDTIGYDKCGCAISHDLIISSLPRLKSLVHSVQMNLLRKTQWKTIKPESKEFLNELIKRAEGILEYMQGGHIIYYCKWDPPFGLTEYRHYYGQSLHSSAKKYREGKFPFPSTNVYHAQIPIQISNALEQYDIPYEETLCRLITSTYYAVSIKFLRIDHDAFMTLKMYGGLRNIMDLEDYDRSL